MQTASEVECAFCNIGIAENDVRLFEANGFGSGNALFA